ncbi:MAG: hypothetical protein QOE93_1882, partial [Actinomycetota bacterium]|nr:hypothetical protein [Actinomycetota bacterium]
MLEQNDVVSVVILHEGPLADTVVALQAVADLDFPSDRIEVVLVDLDPLGGSADRLRQAAPDAIVVAPKAKGDSGRAAVLNRAAHAANGASLAFLGSGHVPDRRWLQASLDVLDRDHSVACVGAWAGPPPAVSFLGHPLPGRDGSPEGVQDVLYAPAEAMVVRADVFRDVGGFDVRYERFLDDLDLGWRLWLLGHRVVSVPDVAVAAPPAGGRSERSVREQFLRERNALFTIYKNYDDASLAVALPPALALGIRRAMVLGGDGPLPPASAPMDLAPMTASAPVVASAHAIDAFVQSLPELTVTRRDLQARRRRTDQEIFRLMGRPLGTDPGAGAAVGDHRYQDSLDAVIDALGVRDRFGTRRRVVVATCDTLAPAMAGPAIRAWQIASALSVEHDVQLVTTSTASVTHPRFAVRSVD